MPVMCTHVINWKVNTLNASKYLDVMIVESMLVIWKDVISVIEHF